MKKNSSKNFEVVRHSRDGFLQKSTEHSILDNEGYDYLYRNKTNTVHNARPKDTQVIGDEVQPVQGIIGQNVVS